MVLYLEACKDILPWKQPGRGKDKIINPNNIFFWGGGKFSHEKLNLLKSARVLAILSVL